MDYQQDYYKGVAKYYFLRVVDTIISLGNLRNERGIILDFGCGFKYLKRRLNKDNVVGYDIISQLSDVRDYKRLKPRVIVCNNILEHFTVEQIRKQLTIFKKMNPSARLITATPTENFLSKLGMMITGIRHAHEDHKTKIKIIHQLVQESYTLVKKKNVFTLSEIALWYPKL